jgi:hypothetical protein
MLHKITPKRYVILSIILLIASYFLELLRKEDCAWDGCIPAHHISLTSAFFGLPLVIFEIEIILAGLLSIARFVINKKRPSRK